MLEFDVETTGLQPFSASQYAFMYQFFDGEKSAVIHFNPFIKDKLQPKGNLWDQYLADTWNSNRAEIQAWFDRTEELGGIRAWNSNFDRSFADSAGFDVPGDGWWHDGMLAAHAIDERRSVALKAVSSSIFGEQAADKQKEVKAWLATERKRRKKAAEAAGEELEEPNYSDVPNEIMEPYGLEDVYLTRKASDHFEPILHQSPDLKKTYEFERQVMDAVYAVVKRGLPADAGAYHSLEHEVVCNLEKLEDEVQQLALAGGIEDLNPKSSGQIHKALIGRKANLSFMSEKDGKLPMDADNLRACDDELADAILRFRSEYKVLSTYVRPMVGRSYVTSMRHWKEPFIAPDGRIHANYRQIGAQRTARMSCSDPNIQNFPRDDLRLRYNIVADPGYVFVDCDLSNIEMVLFAAFCGEGKLLEAVRRGEDLHLLTAKMLGLKDRKRAGGAIETARQLGKTYNFSRVYGGGLRTIKRQFRCSMDEARLLKRRFDNAYPEVKNLTERIEYRLMDQGYISDHYISGRRWRVAPSDAYKATNYLVQGTASSVLKKALVALHKDGVPIVALVHDEILAHVPIEDAEEAKHLIIKRMTDMPELGGIVPLRAEGDIVKRWSDAKPNKDGSLFVPDWALR